MRKRKDRKEAKQETWEQRELEADILRERERARARGGTDVMERNKKCLNDNGVQRKRGRGSER